MIICMYFYSQIKSNFSSKINSNFSSKIKSNFSSQIFGRYCYDDQIQKSFLYWILSESEAYQYFLDVFNSTIGINFTSFPVIFLYFYIQLTAFSPWTVNISVFCIQQFLWFQEALTILCHSQGVKLAIHDISTMLNNVRNS